MILAISITLVAFSALVIVWLSIALVERCLQLIDKSREIIKTASLDAVQIWTSGHMAGIDVSRERGKLLLAQDYGQVRLDEYRTLARFKLVEHRRQLQAGNEVQK